MMMKRFGGLMIGAIFSCLVTSLHAQGALQFDGVNDYVSFGSAPGLGSDVFTVETWFQRTGTGSSASTGTGGVVAIPLVTKGRGEADGNNLDMNYFLGIRESDGVLVADFEEGASGTSPGLNHPVIGNTVVSSNVWHHAAVSYDGTKWQLFLDGVLDAELVVGQPPRGDSIQHAALGTALNSGGTPAGYFAGTLDEVRIWNYARSEAQIASHYQQEIETESGLLGRWALDEVAGTTAGDSAGAQNDGTLSGGPVWGDGYSFVPLPESTLISPADQGVEIGPGVTFTCEASDANELASATLYIGLEGGALSPVETKVITGTSATVNFTTSLADGQSYIWNCLVTNSVGGQRWAASDFVVVVDANYPDQPVLVGPLDAAVDVAVPPVLEVQVSDPNADAMTVSFYGRDTHAEDFTVVALPDTQYYVSALNGGTPAMFNDQADWIVANRLASNIVFVSHLGDVVQSGDLNQAEWLNATDSMYRLEYPSQGIPYGIPYGIAIGNHDQTPEGDPDGTTAFFNQYFGESHFAGRSYYGGHFGTDNDNSYQLITASDIDLIFIHLEYDPVANPAVLEWADGLLKAHGDRLAVVSTHHLVGSGSPAQFSPQGQAIYDALKANSNLILMLGGHVTGEARRVDTYNGNTVHSLLADFQNGTNGGSGWMRLLEFSPSTDEIRVKTYSPTLDQFDTDAESEFTLSVPLNPGFKLIGEVQNVASGATASIPWSDAAVDSDYEWFVTATDSTGRLTSGAIWGFDTAPFDLNPPLISGVTAVNVTDHAAEIIWTTDEIASSLVDYGDDANYGSQLVDSSYVASHSITIANLAPGQTYHYRVRSVDQAGNASDGVDLTFTTATEDLTPPTPDPLGWASVPTSAGPSAITMTATTASDSAGVEYYFENLTDPAHDSGWQAAATFTDTLLLPDTAYSYRVRARDLSPANNETGYSAQASATTGAGSALVTRGPYLQNGKPDGVSIMWRTDNFTDGRVWFGDSPENLDQVVDEPVPPAPLIPRGSTWRYLADGSNQGTAWRDPAFDDSGWSQGAAQLGYGDGDEATVLGFGGDANNKFITNYFRYEFTVTGAAGIPALELGLMRDDGAVVYLNGSELRRDNLPGGTIGFNTLASSAIGGSSETIFYVTSVDPALLLEGTNVIAVEVHQANLNSSDISFDLELYQPQPGGGGDGFDHLVRIGGLDPNTTYYYQIGTAQGEVLAGGDADYHFVTLPTPGSTQPVRLWALGDSGTADNNARAVRDAYLRLSAIEQPADALLMLGDNAYTTGTDTEYQNAVFQNMYEDILRNRVLWSTQGNHDTGAYFDIFDLPVAGEAGGVASGTEDYYSIDYANVHLICLSSEDLTLCSDPDSPMYQWLNADLLATTQPWIIAYWHHPAYTKGSHDSDNAADSGGRMEYMRTIALPILEAGGVDLVLSGHSHSYERSMFIKGHYGLSGSFDAGTHVVQVGDGDPAGDGAYVKSGEDGAVYITAGSSGKISGVAQHQAMQIWLNNLGSVIIDVDHDKMDVRFLRELDPIQIDDVFQITKNLGPDLDPPAPDPMTWASAPAAVDSTSVTMTATTAIDPSGVEYLFENLTVPGHDSGWQAGASWVDSGLDPATSYTYRVSARDQSPAQNQTAPSATASAMTEPDTTPPTPNGMTWAVVPTAVNTKSITMTATTASDLSGVEYQFTRMGDPAVVSAWQASPTFVDSGLQPDTAYFYQVVARDLSPAQNITDPSIAAPATTLSDAVTIEQAAGQADPTNTDPINFTVVFDQAVTGFETGDVTLGGTAGATTGTVTAVDGMTYNVAVSGMTAEGTVIASIAAGVALDPAGDGNAASSSSDNIVDYDAAGPTVTINQAAGQAGITNSGPIEFTVVFSESVDDFTTGDVSLGGSAGATAAVVTGSGTTYNVAVSGMAASGTVMASVGAGVASDAAGNPNTASTSTDNSVTFDLDVPSVSGIARVSSSPTGAAGVDFTVTFSEPVSGVDVSDFALALGGTATGTIAGVSGGGASYTVAVAGVGGDGSIGLDLVDDDSIVDGATNALGGAGAGNGNFVGEIYEVDQTAPTVVITSAVSAATSQSPIPLSVTFSEAVGDFDLADIMATGGILGGFAGTGAAYTVELTPDGDGPLTIDVAAGAATDAAGNGNLAAGQWSVIFDSTAPQVASVLRDSDSPTVETSVGYTVTFSEPVAGIDVGDFSLAVTGTVAATVNSVSAEAGTSVTVTVSGITGAGTLRLDVAEAASITDAAGNALAGGYLAGEAYEVDQGAVAVVSIARASATPTAAAVLDYLVVFSEAVTGVDATDFTLVLGGTASGTISAVTGSDTSYTVSVSAVSGDGTLGLNLVDDDSIIDITSAPLAGAGAGNGDFVGQIYTIDQTGPTVVIGSSAGDPTNESPIAVTITFSEAVEDFALGDITVTGGTLDGFAGSGVAYSVNLTASGDGPVTVDVLGGVAGDAAGNANLPAAQLALSFDATDPVVASITRASATPTGASGVAYDVEFSEAVSGVDAADFSLVATGTANGVIAAVSGGGASYSVTVSDVDGDGTLGLDLVDDDSIADAAANALGGAGAGNGDFIGELYTIDQTGPTVTISSAAGDPTNVAPIAIAISFSEPVEDFDSGDITVTGGVLGGFAGSGAGYSVALTPSGDGLLSVDIAGAVTSDAAGNPNAPAAQFSITYDATAPAVTSIIRASGAATGAPSVDFVVTYSEVVEGVDVSDFTLATTGTAAGAISGVAGAGASYTVTVSGISGDGTLGLDLIDDDSIADVTGNPLGSTGAGNGSFSGEIYSIDQTSPSVLISSNASNPTNGYPIALTITFSEPVTDFTVGDISVVGGTLLGFTGSGADFSADLTPFSQGALTVDVAAGVAGDAAGNGNTAAPTFAISYDSIPPAVTINQAIGQADPASSGPVNFTVVFSEPVTGFATGDVVISGTAGATTGTVTALDALSYNVAVTGMSGLGTVEASIGAGVAIDAAGNANAASSSTDNSVTLEAAGPVVLFADGFESGDLATGGWIALDSSATTSGNAASTGTWGVELRGDTWIERSVSTTGFESIVISYSRYTSAFDNGEALTVEWSVADGPWNPVESTQITSYAPITHQPLAGAADSDTFKIRFRTNGDRKNERGYVDDVQITGIPTGPPPAPGMASAPDPADGATGVSHSIGLSWTAGSNTDSHSIYFGTNPAPGAAEAQGNQGGTSFDPGVLAYATTYYWRVDEVNAIGTTSGTVWSFTTLPPPPAPGQASAPSPADGATGVSNSIDLSWTAGSNADSHSIYFGTNSTPGAAEAQGNQGGTSFDPGALAYETTYYWRVDEVNAIGTTTGTVWSFTTTAAPTGPLSLFSDGFESGDLAAGGWVTTDGSASVKGSAVSTGTFGLELKAVASVERLLSTAGYRSIKLKYSRMTSAFDSGEALLVEWWDGNIWHPVESTQDGSWASPEWPLGTGADNNPQFKIRFSTNGDRNNEKANIDDVEVTGIPD